jgi:hypothetical protein
MSWKIDVFPFSWGVCANTTDDRYCRVARSRWLPVPMTPIPHRLYNLHSRSMDHGWTSLQGDGLNIVINLLFDGLWSLRPEIQNILICYKSNWSKSKWIYQTKMPCILGLKAINCKKKINNDKYSSVTNNIFLSSYYY